MNVLLLQSVGSGVQCLDCFWGQQAQLLLRGAAPESTRIEYKYHFFCQKCSQTYFQDQEELKVMQNKCFKSHAPRPLCQKLKPGLWNGLREEW